MIVFAYNLILFLLSPLIALFILHRIFVTGKSRNSWRQQLGGAVVPKDIAEKGPIWIHAVSVGESVAGAAVVAELKKLLPGVPVVFSTTTETGRQMADKSVKEYDVLLYYPFDLLPCVSRSISRVKPVVFASTDTEIWPNFLHIARKRGVRTALINGTISDKTLRGARKVPFIYRWSLGNIDRFCMQSKADCDRIIKIGADADRVSVVGNCKADQSSEPMTSREKQELKQLLNIPMDAPVFVAGSTNPGEDEPVLDAFLHARKAHPGLRLIIAPRQIERAAEIHELVNSKGLKCGFRNDTESLRPDTDVIILNTFGELADIYGIADVTFVGGSLIPKGCHSILQPIAQGKPVFFGPHTFKARDLTSQAINAGIGFQIADAAQLGDRMGALLADPSLVEDIRLRCEKMMNENRGASRRCAETLAELYRGARE